MILKEDIIMKRLIKDLILLFRISLWFQWLSKPLKFIHNAIELSVWINNQGGGLDLKRNYSKRIKLYKAVLQFINYQSITYLEFGVYRGESIRWWKENAKGWFYGFDSFEGLPEKWGCFKEGSMLSPIPNIDGVVFIKGLFQKSLPAFLKEHEITGMKIIHMDADLFSSTLFVLSTLFPYLEKGDIIIFDEFNCPNDEFAAFKIFCDCFHIKPELLFEVNNYHQVAFKL
jgi:O-methyltransferase